MIMTWKQAVYEELWAGPDLDLWGPLGRLSCGGPQIRGVDPGGGGGGLGGSRPPNENIGGGGANISFCPPIILTTWKIINVMQE